MGKFDRTFFWLRNVLAGLPLVYALVSTRWQWENKVASWSIATTLCIAGIIIRSWACAHCNYGQTKARRLATTGPYAIVRNPLYWGNLFLIAGATIASGLVWLLPISVLWAWAVYSVVFVAYEDTRLLRWYGDEYRRYRSVVPAWIPAWRGPIRYAPLSWRAVLDESFRVVLLLPFIFKELY